MTANEDVIRRAKQAQAIFDDPIMQQAREHIDAELYRLFKVCAPTDLESLQQVKAMQYMHDKYLAFFKNVLNDGKVAQMQLEQARPRPKGY
jgi:hypothetical protein